MGFLDNKLVAKFINGGAPPKSFTKQIRDRPPPDYEKHATTQQRVADEGLQRSMVYLDLPTRRERELLESEERERRGYVEWVFWIQDAG
jgi:hypothetical protein